MNPKRLEQRRAFNEQLRARLKLVAAERGIPDADMKWLGRLRHDDLVAFIQKHGLNVEWVYRGGQQPPNRSLRVIQGGMTTKIIKLSTERGENHSPGSERDRIHANAFRELESRICDCEKMADIAMQLAQPLLGGLETGHEQAFFAVIQTQSMLEKLKADYLAMYNEPRSAE
jgi:hypothetical protein